jgi:alanyl-tRNA synthetase
MATEKLYWHDSAARAFEAESARVSRWRDRASIVLPRTLFYPEAGGQLGDHGTVTVGGRAVAIDDAQIDDDGVIHHLIAAGEAPLAEGDLGAVRGAIDDARRRDFTAQHTAQHALSRALLDEANAPTVSSRLGGTVCTIDVDRADIPEREIARAEDLVNAIVTDDVLVRALFPTAEELASMDLRRAPKVSANVRIIDIGGFDLSPCGGTHCARSGQIGTVRISGIERYKGKTRVSFHAAKRALADARAKEAALAALAAELTCGMLDVGSAVAKLRGELKSRTDALATMRGELVDRIAEAAWREHPARAGETTFVTIVRPHDDVVMLRSVAGRLAAREDVVALAIACEEEEEGDDAILVIQRGAAVTGAGAFDCGAWLKSAASAHQGRGGGRPERAEGRIKLTSLGSLDQVASLLPR